VSLQREARMRRFNHYGPWVLGGAAIIALIGYEAARHHVVDRFDVIFFCCLVPTVILHEISHGLVAYWCGDDTAKRAGRLSLNPIRHIDPLGTVLLPILLILTVHQAFGWAKPVPVNIGRLRHPRNQAVLVGLAGPATNVILALVAGFAFRGLAAGNLFGLLNTPIDSWPVGDELLFILGEVNVIIAAFNLIPIPPLDGSAVLERLLPRQLLPGYYRLRQLSMVLVLILVFVAPGVLSVIFDHALTWWGDIVL
jgi:Zn-dependent protease